MVKAVFLTMCHGCSTQSDRALQTRVTRQLPAHAHMQTLHSCVLTSMGRCEVLGCPNSINPGIPCSIGVQECSFASLT